ncbi:predicted protein [Chaetoceros tenuissimus]|uniref:Uncharacterized protein n=1 Tax=Chaetoceros tenuissimus TaxID=426638 RepID=A0AAD3H4Q2_9STRA|nr:predicted protein [Chaetoceros tenuissimus]
MPVLAPVGPVYPPGATQHQISASDRVHTEQRRRYNEAVAAEQALKKQLTEIIKRIYLNQRLNNITGVLTSKISSRSKQHWLNIQSKSTPPYLKELFWHGRKDNSSRPGLPSSNFFLQQQNDLAEVLEDTPAGQMFHTPSADDHQLMMQLVNMLLEQHQHPPASAPPAQDHSAFYATQAAEIQRSGALSQSNDDSEYRQTYYHANGRPHSYKKRQKRPKLVKMRMV